MYQGGGKKRGSKHKSSIFIGGKGVNPEKEGDKEERVFCMEGVVCAKVTEVRKHTQCCVADKH